MTIIGRRLAGGLVCIAFFGASRADPAPVQDVSDFVGVWAPEMRGPPGGPGRPGRPPGLGGPLPEGGPARPGPGGPIKLSVEDQAKGLDPGDVRTRSEMTDEGKAKFATFDPLQHPASNCKTPGLPSIAQIPELQQWTLTGNEITIRHESWQTVRVVHLDQTTHPVDSHSVIGHAIGKFDDGRLVIETANLNAEWGGLGRNAPGSDERTVRETYRLLDHDTIQGWIEISDPRYLKHPLTMPVRLKRQPPQTEIVDFPCDVEVSQRDYQYIGAANQK